MSTFRFRRSGALAAFVAASCLVLVGCASDSKDSPATPADKTAEAAGDDMVTGPGGPIEGKTVYYVACSDQNQWCRAYNNLLVKGLEDKGVKVTYLQDPYDPVLQVQHLNQAISQQPDAIILLASDARAVIPGLAKAQQAGIPVVNVIGPTVPESDEYYAASIVVNHDELGANAATLMIQGLQEEGIESGNVIAITGASVQPEVAVRMDGFKRVLAEHPEYELVEEQDGAWDQVKTATIAQQLFAKYADKGGIVGAYGMADHQAAGIIQSAQQAGLKVGVAEGGLIVVGSNCFKVGIDNIEKGLAYGTSPQAAGAEAEFTLPLLEKFLSGEAIPRESLTTEPPITKDNVEEWKERCSVA
ncbi:MAG: sugar ABC transporter substrate-binding protein [Micrococcales bacterium]|nr:sugar ABC transporter substrate-binding protein [Micrococcales bacterium]